MPETRAALARTYRPRRFSEVAMQEHVADTLRTAVARGRVAHAYLFTGPRGVGKTTAARVLAMALNCPNRTVVAGEEGEGEPCGVCDSCERIWAGRTSLDVVEIDAASNRGVDDARDLRERAMYAPTDEHRFKVYIIDEAHMLTREAWNALLKILEEPPSRVIFIFATTEPQKILQAAPPILSRCQRFDFRRIPVGGIVERLRLVLAGENVEADDDALLPIARRAEGGMRDALSLLDQVLSFAEGRVREADVRLVLGLIGDELYIELFDILASRRFGDVFRFVEKLLDEGYDLTEFYRGLADALRTLLEAKFDGVLGENIREDLKPAFMATADRFGEGDLLRMLALVAELDVEGRFRKSGNPRTMLESLLLRFAWMDRTVAIEDLIGAGGGTPPTPPAGTQPGRPSQPAQRSARDDASADGRRQTAQPPRAPTAAGPPQQTTPPGIAPTSSAATGAEAAVADDTAETDESTSQADEAMSTGFARSADEALRRLIRKRDAVPNGILFFLAAANARLSGDTVILELPAGPGLERLSSEAATRGALQSAFSEELGRPVTVDARARGAESDAHGARRLTPERVRNDQLARLSKTAPLLNHAVEVWDLELMD